MENIEIVFSPASQRELKKLERRDQIIVFKKLEELESCPRPSGMEKIQGHPKFYRVSAGRDHRIIYHIFQEKLLVVLVIRDRKEAYRSLGDLDGKLAVALQAVESRAVEEIRLSNRG